MDAFESLIEMLLKKQGYWTRTSFKVELTPAEKCKIERPSSPRWELDVVAYKGGTNEVLAVECKSYLDSTGVRFKNGVLEPPRRYKLFSNKTLRRVVLGRLSRQLVQIGAVRPKPNVTLCLAAGHIASQTDPKALGRHMDRNGWRLFDERWIIEQIQEAAMSGYENDVAHIVSKIIYHNKNDSL